MPNPHNEEDAEREQHGHSGDPHGPFGPRPGSTQDGGNVHRYEGSPGKGDADLHRMSGEVRQ